MHDEACDAAGLLEAHQRPRLPRIERTVDALSDRDVAADACLRPCPPTPRSDRTWRTASAPIDCTGCASKIGVQFDAAVGRLEDAARGGADVVGVGISGDPRRRGKAITLRTDGAPMEAAVDLRARPLCCWAEGVASTRPTSSRPADSFIAFAMGSSGGRKYYLRSANTRKCPWVRLIPAAASASGRGGRRVKPAPRRQAGRPRRSPACFRHRRSGR